MKSYQAAVVACVQLEWGIEPKGWTRKKVDGEISYPCGCKDRCKCP